MHLTIQRPWKPDKLSQGAHNQTSYPRIQWENTLDKRGATEPMKESNPERIPTNDRGEHKVKSKDKDIGLPMLQEARNQA